MVIYRRFVTTLAHYSGRMIAIILLTLLATIVVLAIYRNLNHSVDASPTQYTHELDFHGLRNLTDFVH